MNVEDVNIEDVIEDTDIEISQEDFNYNDGNGTIIEKKIENNKIITIRKHEDRLELFSVHFEDGGRANGENVLVIVDEPKSGAAALFTLPEHPVMTRINTVLLRYEKSLNDDKPSSWLYVKTDDGIAGWLYLGVIPDPYENDIWSIEEIITTPNEKWTVRKMDGGFGIWGAKNVMDKPGFNAAVLFQLDPPPDNPESWVEILAITEEEARIDNNTDYWVKIMDKQGRIGWIFGGYGGVSRGGPTYRIPRDKISFQYVFP